MFFKSDLKKLSKTNGIIISNKLCFERIRIETWVNTTFDVLSEGQKHLRLSILVGCVYLAKIPGRSWLANQKNIFLL